MTARRFVAVSATIAAAIGLAGCSAPEADIRIPVVQTDTSCDVETTTFSAGVVTFVIDNSGTATTEFYVLDATAESIITEAENLTPGVPRELTVELATGTYTYSCETSDGDVVSRGELTVTESSAINERTPAEDEAIAEYSAFVEAEATALLSGTEEFAAAITAGDAETARQLYASTRAHWERIEPVAESFGDLDPRMDAREGDLDPGVEWTGWHALEKQLWVTGLDASSADLAAQLVADTNELVTAIDSLSLTLSQMTNGAKALMDEVAGGKITGEEERYSHVDLWDIDANVTGARKVVEVLADVLAERDPELLGELTARFDALQEEMSRHIVGDGFALYDDVSETDIRALSDLVEAVSEPLATLTAVVVR